MLERLFGLGGGAQEGNRAAISSGAIDLPPKCPLYRRDFDRPRGVHADKLRLQAPLGIGVGDHCLTESIEIPSEDGVASGSRRVS